MKPKRLERYRTALCFILIFELIVAPVIYAQQAKIPGFYGNVNLPEVSSHQLPEIKQDGILEGITGISTPQANKLIIHQDKKKAIIDWDTFNIGKEAWTHFDQKGNADWAALNRIYDQNPSLIFGRLTADGKVYLINQNGILFMPGSQINVSTLSASSLNMFDNDFNGNLQKYYTDDYTGSGNLPGVVANHGNITTSNSGAVFLVAPNVENSGLIDAPLGRIFLGAGETVEITQAVVGDTVQETITVDKPGTVINHETGHLISDLGSVAIYGRIINQNGLIRATTAVRKNGKIELHATEKITTGIDSITESPISSSDELVNQSFSFNAGEIIFNGIDNNDLPQEIEHAGRISAPSGTVTLEAEERIDLKSESQIDVSGNWVDKSVEDNLITATLNSVDLRDDYGQKEGILKGEDIVFDAITGSQIGNISGYLLVEDRTAREQSTSGGSIYLLAEGGLVNVETSALLDISGGGLTFDGGFGDTTKLLSGTRLYDISTAPQWIKYDKIFDQSELSFGGVNTVRNFRNSYIQGADAGLLNIVGQKNILDGNLWAAATAGIYQTEDSEPEDTSGYQTASGRARPKGGELYIGPILYTSAFYDGKDPVVEEIIIANTPGSDGDSGITYITPRFLNDAGLSLVDIKARKSITITEESDILLPAGAEFEARSRRIVHQGRLSAPSGSVVFELHSNVTTNPESDDFIDIADIGQERVYLASGSLIDVSGEEADNSLSDSLLETILKSAMIDGGSVTLTDETVHGEGVISVQDSIINVSGGYQIDVDGNLTGGDAGRISMTGTALVTEGDYIGLSLPGSNGGALELHGLSFNVIPAGDPQLSLADEFGATSDLPEDFLGKILVAADQFNEGGFTDISLKSYNDITVQTNVNLEPSYLKYALPVSAADQISDIWINPVIDKNGQSIVSNSNSVVTVEKEQIGHTSFTFKTGVNFGEDKLIPKDQITTTDLNVLEGANIAVASHGSIVLNGENIDFRGCIEAPSGKVNIISTNTVIRNNAEITAKADFFKTSGSGLTSQFDGYSALSGGNISLGASGTLILEPGSCIDVSSTENKMVYIHDSFERMGIQSIAGDPGTIALTYFNAVDENGESLINGDILGKSVQTDPNNIGGTLLVTLIDPEEAYEIFSDDISTYINNGFDDIRISAYNGLVFSDSVNAGIGRKLVFDAPSIRTHATDTTINITAPWVELRNTYLPASGSDDLSETGYLSINGEFIDITGGLSLSGFSQIHLNADTAIRLSDYKYSSSSINTWLGRLSTNADLTISSGSIYPTTASDFIIKTPGKVSTESSQNKFSGLVYSAGGKLTINAGDIEHNGVIAAPMGEVVLTAENRLYLGAESQITTTGQFAVQYGALNSDDSTWTITDKDQINSLISVTHAPDKGVYLSGKELITRDGALIASSGGGEIFAYQFMPGINGSENPLSKTDYYILLPDNPQEFPGRSVVIDNSSIVPSGTYSLISLLDHSELAFFPGAIMLEDIGSAAGQLSAQTAENYYPILQARFGYTGSKMSSMDIRNFIVRDAADILSEGEFNYESYSAGDGGIVSAVGQTNILNGNISIDNILGYNPGSLEVSGRDIIIGSKNADLGSDFNFDTTWDSSPDLQALTGKLYVNADGLSQNGGGRLVIGSESTEYVTVEQGASLAAGAVSLMASSGIVMEEESSVVGHGDSGSVTVASWEGKIQIKPTSTITATEDITIKTNNLEMGGQIELPEGTLTLIGDKISFITDKYAGEQADNLFIQESLWRGFDDIANVQLFSNSDIVLYGSIDLTAGHALVIDSTRITGAALTKNDVSFLRADNLRLYNTDSTASDFSSELNNGTLVIDADRTIIGNGDVLIDGYNTINIADSSDVIFSGAGSFSVSGDLSIDTAKISLQAFEDENYFESVLFTVQTDTGQISVTDSMKQSLVSSSPGGSLTMAAQSIDHAGTIDAFAGYVSLTATGTGENDGIFLRNGSEILAGGGRKDYKIDDQAIKEYYKAGSIALSSEGKLSIEGAEGEAAPGAVLDVSNVITNDDFTGFYQSDPIAAAEALDSGVFDAGSIVVTAQNDIPVINGVFKGQAVVGKKGNINLDANDYADFNTIFQLLQNAQFTNEVTVRARNGSLNIPAGQTLKARSLKLVSDNNRIDIFGLLDATGDVGGDIQLIAGDSINLHAGSSINSSADGQNANGGHVTLITDSGTIGLEDGTSVFTPAVIDVSGTGLGDSGNVLFRVSSDELLNTYNTDNKVIDLKGVIRGAAMVSVEALKTYEIDGNISNINTYRTNADNLMLQQDNIKSGLLENITMEGWGSNQFFVLPGIELWSSGNISLNQALDLTSWKNDGYAGTLIIRAQGDLNLNKNIVDHPTSTVDLPEILSGTNQPADSWNLTLTAGTDLSSPDPTAAMKDGNGNLNIGNGVLIYTESGQIKVSSAGNMNTGSKSDYEYMDENYLGYNLGTYDGDISGFINGNVVINGGAVQTAIADIRFNIGGDLILATSPDNQRFIGTIRTTGQPDSIDDLYYYDLYKNGGRIVLDVAGSLKSALRTDNWDMEFISLENSNAWAANYDSMMDTQALGVVTMAGGDIIINAGGNVRSQIGAFGKGDLRVSTGGNIDGRYLVKDGTASLYSYGNLGTYQPDQAIEAFDADIFIRSEGYVQLGTVLNPTLAKSEFFRIWNLSYQQDSLLDIKALHGDVLLTGETGFYSKSTGDRERILPPALNIIADRDILIQNDFVLPPSESGNLELLAGRDISGLFNAGGVLRRGSIVLSDADPDSVYGYIGTVDKDPISSSKSDTHAEIPVHINDSIPVSIQAGQDISSLALYLSKQATISANEDINNLFYFGQNINPEDITRITAGEDIIFNEYTDQYNNGVQHGGPGILLLCAGNTIDLGTTEGIQVFGNLLNINLGQEKSTLVVMSGYSDDSGSSVYSSSSSADAVATESVLSGFFDELREAGDTYSRLLDKGDVQSAGDVVAEVIEDTIQEFLEDTTAGTGNVNMEQSQIYTSGSQGDVFMISNNTINVGKSSFTQSGTAGSNTGIYTTSGGSINMYSENDINVNESRVMTFAGGDITLWSNSGDINAGRGSRTAINASQSRAVKNDDGTLEVVFDPPAVGSGVRALTFDPDGMEGPKEAPEIGDVFLFAPQGIIDAGEAGIAGGDVTLGATEVLNTQNIEVAGLSVGGPQTSTGPSMGTLAGAGTVSETARMAEESAAMNSAEDRFASRVAQLSDQLVPKWIAVEVIGFDKNDEEGQKDEDIQ